MTTVSNLNTKITNKKIKILEIWNGLDRETKEEINLKIKTDDVFRKIPENKRTVKDIFMMIPYF